MPEILDTDLYDKIITVTTEEAMEYMAMIAKKEGLFVGITGGAALYAAVKTAEENPGSTVAVLLPDTGERYLSILE